MGTIHGGRIVAKALRAENVPFVFTLCGGHVMPIYDGCVDEGIRVIDVRHEQTAAHAADGWARVTGRPGRGGGHRRARTDRRRHRRGQRASAPTSRW